MSDRVAGHYVLQRSVGPQGKLSVVRRGVDDRDLSHVAVKFVQAKNDDMTRRLFERETGALRSLQHRNIVRFRDAGVDDSGTYYLILDWVDRTLNDVLADRPWTNWPELYRSLVKPLLDGIAHAHLKRIEHRDIKPANILIDAEGQPLLADFGIAKLRGDEPHSEHTVQAFRSGAYAPPELEARVPYVRDVYSVGVVVLQCLSDSKILDYPDIAPALEAARVPPDVRKLLEACVSFDPDERPNNAVELASRFQELWLQQAAEIGQQRNVVWLDLTLAASGPLSAAASDGQSAQAVLQNDLSGQVNLEFGRNRETGERDRAWLFMYGSEFRYSLVVNPGANGRIVVTAAKQLELDELEHGRRRSMPVPPVFTWSAQRPLDSRGSAKAWELVEELLDKYDERRDHPESVSDADGDEQFDTWLRVLDARAELARGDLQPLRFRRSKTDGRRVALELVEMPPIDLVGTEWELFDPGSGRRFGNGEVIDQNETEITLLGPRRFGGVPRASSIRPYDAPSAIALARQRAALLSVKSELTPNAGLKGILLNPASNAEPHEANIAEWSAPLDTAKQRAVRMALGAPEALLVEGPPGTGKTRFIVEAVTQFLAAHPEKRVLIASQTNVAVDNAVERLHASGLETIVRLAGSDDTVVAPSVRSLLLAQQMPRWAAGVRTQAEASVAKDAVELGLELNHARAALVLEQLVTVSLERERVEAQLELVTTAPAAESDLATAVDEGAQVDELQARLDHLDERKTTLAKEAQGYLADLLTIPADLGSDDARFAISAIVGDSEESRRFLQRLALQAEWLERIESDDGLTGTFLAGRSVVAGTCIGLLRNRAMANLEFDLCIVDEASRATLTEAIVPMSRARSWILVGDTRQLPPSDEDLLRRPQLLTEYAVERDDITETLFQRFADNLPKHSQLLLDEQYRMVKPIGDLISSCFYDGQLRSSRSDGLAGYGPAMGASVVWLDTGPLGDRRREQSERTTSIANRTEVQVMFKQFERLDAAIDKGLVKVTEDAPLEVLAIAPYKSQVEDITRRLATKSFRHIRVVPQSVDAVQGREADVAFFSVTRSNAQGRLGFLGPDYWRRINVALSRARYGLTIIGDADFIRGTNGALRKVLQYMESHHAECSVRSADQ